MLEKATFFVLETRYTNRLRVTTTDCNSYPYYQDKKRLVSLVLKTTKKTLKMMVFLLLNLKDITANKKTIEKQKKRLIND